jgi:hypothetical protein
MVPSPKVKVIISLISLTSLTSLISLLLILNDMLTFTTLPVFDFTPVPA